MNKIIITTTINPPTEALLKFSQMTEWHVVVAGDLKTPHKEYTKLQNITYLSPEDQEKISKELSDAIGWKCIQRRNFALIQAYRMGADVVATIDDDNIPYSNWGSEIFVNESPEVCMYSTSQEVFDPLFATEHSELWHRGFPLQLVAGRESEYAGKKIINCLIQADLWDGDHDIDAVVRISRSPVVKFNGIEPYTSDKIAPFNSQNTFLSRSVIPYYMVLPHVGRMDDIWGAYILQQRLSSEMPFTVYNKPTVYQDRNPQDLVKNLENELIGYNNTLNLIRGDYRKILPSKALVAYDIYCSMFSEKVQ